MLVQEATTEIPWSQHLVLSIHLHAIMMPTTCTEVLVSVFQEMVEYMRTKNSVSFFFLVILHHDGIITPWNRGHAYMLRCFHLCDHKWHLSLSGWQGKTDCYTQFRSEPTAQRKHRLLDLGGNSNILSPSPSVALTRRQRPREEHQIVQYQSARNPGYMGFPGDSDGKESTCNAGDLGLIPGLGRSPGGGHGNPL